MSSTILVVEDEPSILDLLVYLLEKNEFNVLQAADYHEAKTILASNTPDLVLLDWMLPGGSGIKIARELKQSEQTRNISIIMLTARSEEEDKLMGFDVGIDDYITKPFSSKELVARVKAVARRNSAGESQDPIEVNGLKLDPVSHRVTLNDNPVVLGPTEFKMLHFFMTHPERVYSRDQLLDNIWGTNVFVEDRTVDVHIRRLRKSISEYGHELFVQTVRGSGYRFSSKI